jgi:hypothetical protein
LPSTPAGHRQTADAPAAFVLHFHDGAQNVNGKLLFRAACNKRSAGGARAAEVLASGTVTDSDPAKVINRLVRDLPGKWDNRWATEMKPGGVWLELQRSAPL